MYAKTMREEALDWFRANKNKKLSLNDISNQLFGYDYDETVNNNLRVHICGIRKLLAANESLRSVKKGNHRGFKGYIFEVNK